MEINFQYISQIFELRGLGFEQNDLKSSNDYFDVGYI